MNITSPTSSGWLTRLWRAARRPLVWGLLLSVVLLYTFMELAEEVMQGERIAFDTTIINLVRGAASEALTRFMLVVTMLGDWRVLLAIGLVAGLLWWRRGQRSKTLLLASGALGGALLDQVLKLIFHRTRPDTTGWLMNVQGYSFPSGHAMMSLCLYGMLIYLLVAERSRLVQLLGLIGGALLILTIGVSRIYLGVHYPSDIVGGFTAGLVWLVANVVAYTEYRTRALARRVSRIET